MSETSDAVITEVINHHLIQ